MKSTKTKITILGDSLSLPRPSEGIAIDDTYPLKLSQSDKLIILNKSKVSADTEFFLESQQLYYDIRYSNSQYFIIHLGICDCSPRLFTKKEKKLFSILEDYSLFAKWINFYIAKKSKERLYYTKERQIQNVPLHKFQTNYVQIIEEIFKYNLTLIIFVVSSTKRKFLHEIANKSF